MVKILTESTFDDTIKNAGVPVLVDFWAEWCGPCRMFSPIIEEVSEECGDSAMICKLNTDDAQSIAARYNVMSIPTIILFKDGEPAARTMGVQSKDAVLDFIKQ